MIGIYNYTVILTYLSILSASVGIIVSLSGTGHPYIGCFFLLFCGLCDAFDGMVARTKKNRSETESKFGIQIDSLSDVVAFGVLPSCIGAALIRTSVPLTTFFIEYTGRRSVNIMRFVIYAILALYILAAMIRLAYFNVTEEERQKTEAGKRKFYVGLPVTSASLIFPFVLLFQYILPADITLVYIGVMLLTGLLFLCRFQVKKPGLRGILIMVGLGAVEFALLIIWKIIFRNTI